MLVAGGKWNLEERRWFVTYCKIAGNAPPLCFPMLALQKQTSNEDNMYPESDDLNDYLVSDTIVDWRTPSVQQKALELTQSISDEVAKAHCLYEWVRDSIPHTNDVGLDIVTCTASEVLLH